MKVLRVSFCFDITQEKIFDLVITNDDIDLFGDADITVMSNTLKFSRKALHQKLKWFPGEKILINYIKDEKGEYLPVIGPSSSFGLSMQGTPLTKSRTISFRDKNARDSLLQYGDKFDVKRYKGKVFYLVPKMKDVLDMTPEERAYNGKATAQALKEMEQETSFNEFIEANPDMEHEFPDELKELFPH